MSTSLNRHLASRENGGRVAVGPNEDYRVERRQILQRRAVHWAPHERRIECPLVQGQRGAADLLESPRDAIAVEWPKRLKGLEDHQAERPIQHVALGGGHRLEVYGSNVFEVHICST